MKDEDRKFCDDLLDFLAGGLRVSNLEDQHKEQYFKSLKKYAKDQVISAVKGIYESYAPRRREDFPVINVFTSALEKVQPDTRSWWDCICCGQKFPAGDFKQMNCGCIRSICYECDKCEKHCRCEGGLIPAGKSKFWREEILPELKEHGIWGKLIIPAISNDEESQSPFE